MAAAFGFLSRVVRIESLRNRNGGPWNAPRCNKTFTGSLRAECAIPWRRPGSLPAGAAVLDASHPGAGTDITAGVQEAPFRLRASARTAHGSTESRANELSAALWDERRHLGELLCLLDTAASQADCQGDLTASAAIEQKMQDVRTAGLARDLAVHALALTWRASEGLTLPEVIAHMPAEPWDFIFSSHRDSMANLITQIARSAMPGLPVDRSTGCAGSNTVGIPAGNAYPSPLVPKALREFVCGNQ